MMAEANDEHSAQRSRLHMRVKIVAAVVCWRPALHWNCLLQLLTTFT